MSEVERLRRNRERLKGVAAQAEPMSREPGVVPAQALRRQVALREEQDSLRARQSELDAGTFYARVLAKTKADLSSGEYKAWQGEKGALEPDEMYADKLDAYPALYAAYNRRINPAGGSAMTDDIIRQATLDEAAYFQYLTDNDDPALDDYEHYLDMVLRSRLSDEWVQREIWLADNAPAAGFVVSRIANLLGQAEAPTYILRQIIDDMRGNKRPINTDEYFFANRAVETIDKRISQNIDAAYGTIDEDVPIFGGKGYGALYNTASSLVDSWLGRKILGHNAAALFVSPAASRTMMHPEERDVDPWTNIIHGLTSGAIEYLTETVLSVEPFFAIAGSNLPMPAGIVLQGLAEGAEEGTADILNLLADNLINGNQSELAQKRRGYRSSGEFSSIEEADKQALKEWWGEVAFSSIGGFVSGMAGMGIEYAGQSFSRISQGIQQNRSVGEQILTNSGEQALGNIIDRLNSALGELSLETEQISQPVDQSPRMIGKKHTQIMNDAERLYWRTVEAEVSRTGGLESGTAARVSGMLQEMGALTQERRTEPADATSGKEKPLPGTPNAAKLAADERRGGFAVDESGRTTIENDDGSRDTIRLRGLKTVGQNDADVVITVDAPNGKAREVKLSDVRFGTDAEAEKYALAANMETPALANAFRTTTMPEQDMVAVSAGMSFAYEQGRIGRKFTEKFKGSVLVSALTPDQLETAYKLGVRDRAAQVESEQAAADARVAALPSEGALDYGMVDKAGLGEMQLSQISAVEAIMKASGMKARLYESVAKRTDDGQPGRFIAPNGYIQLSTGSISLDVNAGRDWANQSMEELAIVSTLSHEMTHAAQRNAPKVYEAYRAMVLGYMEEAGADLDGMIEKAMANDGSLKSHDNALDEIVANASSTMLRDSEYIDRLLAARPAQAKSIGQKIVDFLSKLKETIRKAFAGNTKMRAEVRAIEEYIDRLAKPWADMMLEASGVKESSANTKVPEKVDSATPVRAERPVGVVGEFDEPAMPEGAHIDRRGWDEVSDSGVRAFQNDYKYSRFYMGAAAKVLGYDVEASVPGKRFPLGDDQEWGGQKRQTTDEIAHLIDNGKLTWERLGKTLQAIAGFYEGGDLEGEMPNSLAVKRIELSLDRILTEGYTTMDGLAVAPDRGYIEYKRGLPGADLRASAPENAEYGAFDGYVNADTKYSVRGGKDPENTIIAYKLLRVKKSAKGELFPLFVRANEATPVGIWLDADVGETVNTDKGTTKVKSKLGNLAFRPGWHLGDLPYETHIGKKGKSGKIEFMNDEHVWVEAEVAADVDYQPEASAQPSRDLKKLPVNGLYRFKTNPNMTGEWIITGAMKINRVLSDADVREILADHDLVPLPRANGRDIDLGMYGLDDDVRFSVREFPDGQNEITYESLVQKADMRITDVSDYDRTTDRNKIKQIAIENVLQHGKRGAGGMASIYVADIQRDVHVSRRSIVHGFDRRLEVQSPMMQRIGEVLKNSVLINTAVPKVETADSSYILLGAAKNNKGDMYYATIVVNRFTNDVEKMDIMYAASVKKESAVLNAPKLPGARPVSPTDSTISISDLLDAVKSRFSEILPLDVMEHFGMEREPSEFANKLRYSTRDQSDVSDREILATALENAAQNQAERGLLSDYKRYIGKYDQLQADLTAKRTRIRELTFGKYERTGETRDELFRLRNQADILADQIARQDKKLTNLEAAAPLRALLTRERVVAEKAMRTKMDTKIKAIREQRDAKVEATKQAARERIERLRQGRRDTETRRKTRKLIEEFERRIVRPREGFYIPEELRDSIVALGEGDLRASKGNEAHDMLRRILAAYKATDGVAGLENVYDAQVVTLVEATAESIAERAKRNGEPLSINDLTDVELERVYTVLKAIKHAVVTSIKLTSRESAQNAFEIGAAARQELRESRGKYRSDFMEKAVSMNLDAYGMFMRMFSFDENGSGMQMFHLINDGELHKIGLEMQANRIFDEVLNGSANERELRRLRAYAKDALVDVGLKDAQGVAVPITRGMMLSVYRHLSAEQNLEHIVYGGLTVPDLMRYYRGNFEAWGTGVRRVAGIGGIVSQLRYRQRHAQDAEAKSAIQAQIDAAYESGYAEAARIQQTIDGVLTPYERQLLESESHFHNDFARSAMNEATMKRYGYEIATNESYFPINVDQQFRKGAFDVKTGQPNVAGMGIAQARVEGAKQPILLRDMTDVLRQQIDSVALYAAMLNPVNDFTKIYNTTLAGMQESLKATITDTFGKNAERWIEGYMSDAQRGRVQETTVFDKVKGNYSGAILIGNISSTLKNFTAYFGAPAIVGWKHSLHALARGGKGNMPISRADRALIDTYTPLLWDRARGMTSREMAEVYNMISWGGRIGGKVDVAKLKGALDWINRADAAAAGRMWYAAQHYVDENHPTLKKGTAEEIRDGESAYYKKVAEVFNEIIQRTQQSFTASQLADILRNPNPVIRGMTMFMSQPIKQFGMVYNTAADLRAKAQIARNAPTAESQAALRAARTRFVNATTSFLALSIAEIIAGGLATVVLHRGNPFDDEDEPWWEWMLWGLLRNVLSTVAYGGYVADFVEAVKDKKAPWDIEHGSIAPINDFVQTLSRAITGAQKLFSEDFKSAAEREEAVAKYLKGSVLNTGFSLAKLLGIPAQNVYKLSNGLYRNFQDAANGEFGSMNAGTERPSKYHFEQLFDIAQEGDNEAYSLEFDRVRGELDMSAGAIHSGVKEQIGGAFKSGDISVDEAMSLLRSNVRENKDEAEKTVAGWQYTVDTGRNLSTLKDDYLTGTVTFEEAVEIREKYALVSDPAGTVNEWRYELETGRPYADLEYALLEGEMSEDAVRTVLMEYGGLDKAKAVEKMNGWVYMDETGAGSFSRYSYAYDVVAKNGTVAQFEKAVAGVEADYGAERDDIIGATRSRILAMAKDGKISGEQALKLRIKFLGETFTKNEAYWELNKYEYARKNGTANGYSDYGALHAAIDSGKGIAEAGAELRANGKEKNGANAGIKSRYADVMRGYFGNAQPASVREMMANPKAAALAEKIVDAYIAMGYNSRSEQLNYVYSQFWPKEKKKKETDPGDEAWGG